MAPPPQLAPAPAPAVHAQPAEHQPADAAADDRQHIAQHTQTVTATPHHTPHRGIIAAHPHNAATATKRKRKAANNYDVPGNTLCTPGKQSSRWNPGRRRGTLPGMRTPQEQIEHARREETTHASKPVKARKPVFDVDSLIGVRAPKAGDGFGALVHVAGNITETQKHTVRWWRNLGAGVREIVRITGMTSAQVQDTLTELARECGPVPQETRDDLSARLQTQLDWQRTDLQTIVADETAKHADRIAAHRALLLLARTHADIAGIHRTADTELARSIEALLTAGRQAGQPVMVAVAPALDMARDADAADAKEGERLHRSEQAATRKHYRTQPAKPQDADT